eukprot:TRINITY_DN6688_c0_g2_i1.p1 TRINITY_DN6688_c0_g2~~TRINITY_DN6688_c0_g2_i1.p1  ORF type:complete len:294 (+),score=49.50 TRINITY_DN6688_c0_g2_i1:58-882(+)
MNLENQKRADIDAHIEGPSYFDKIVHGKADDDERVTVLDNLVKITAVSNFLISIIVLSLAFVAKGDGEKLFQTVFAAVLGFVSSVFGWLATTNRSELCTRLYFIFQMWQLSVLTMYLYVNISFERSDQNKCHPAIADYGGIDTVSCQDRVNKSRAKIFVAVFGAILSVCSCMVSLEYNDALNDSMASSSDGGNAKAQRKRRAMILSEGPKDPVLEAPLPHKPSFKEMLGSASAKGSFVGNLANRDNDSTHHIASEGEEEEETKPNTTTEPTDGE